MTENAKSKQREYMREYMKEYRKTNKERIKRIQNNYWEKKTKQED